jgi:1,2-phenylacetyl-CoA epoxidase PaaB subunit
MAIFASTTLGTSDPSRAMSIKALEARAQALAAAQSKQEMPTSMPSPWQGVSHVFNQAADAFATKRADQAAAQRRADLAGYMSQVGPEGPNPQLLGQITAADPDVGKQLAAQAFTARQNAADLQARKEAAAEAARQAEVAAVAQEERLKARPHSDIGQLTADVGRKPTEEEIQAEIRKKTQPSPVDQAAMGQARDENINLQTTAAKLAEAADLLEKGVYHGGGAGTKTEYGQLVPGALQGLTGTDPETTARSKRYTQIMSSEVVAQLKALKGPASNKDMAWAISTVNDPAAPKENKVQALTILRAQMDAHLRSSETTLKGMGTAPVKVDIPAAGATAAPAAPAAGGVQSVGSEAEALKLPPGTKFKLPDGRTGTAR